MQATVNRTTEQSSRTTWIGDLAASVVVFMVALPLCIAIAQASGATAESGIITGVIGGIIVGVICGSPLQVSGPAAGLIVLVVDLMTKSGLAAMGVALALAGVMQFVAGLIRLGHWFRAISPAVIHGMLMGIGIIVVASQFHVLVDDRPTGSPLKNLATIPSAAWKAFNDQDAEFPHHRHAAIVGIASIVVLLLWNALKPRQLQLLPGALVAVITGGVIAWFIPQDIKDVEVQSDLLASIHGIHHAPWDIWLSRETWQAAISIALIASAETLLCATAVDRMHTGPRTNYNRELAAQGVGNMICGCIGVLPMTGVIVRSAANVEAGAKTRWSAVFHGFWLLIFVTCFPSLLGLIPTTCLAAILIVTGYKLIDPRGIREMWQTSRSETFILLITAAAIVVEDLLFGVLTGVVLALGKLVWTFSHLKIRRRTVTGQTVLRLEGAATFLRLPWLADELEKVEPNTELHVDFEKLTYIDHACLELFMNWEKQHEATGGSLVIDWDSLHARFRPLRPPLTTDSIVLPPAKTH